jgi:hypothetical protein
MVSVFAPIGYTLAYSTSKAPINTALCLCKPQSQRLSFTRMCDFLSG